MPGTVVKFGVYGPCRAFPYVSFHGRLLCHLERAFGVECCFVQEHNVLGTSDSYKSTMPVSYKLIMFVSYTKSQCLIPTKAQCRIPTKATRLIPTKACSCISISLQCRIRTTTQRLILTKHTHHSSTSTTSCSYKSRMSPSL